MNFEMSSENRLLAETVRRFIKERLMPLEAAIDAADEIDPIVLQALKKEVIALGLFGYNMPQVLGGPELSVAAQSVIDEELGRTTMPLAEVSDPLLLRKLLPSSVFGSLSFGPAYSHP
jgi:acyl-CoA dehydrogenase